MNNKGLVIALSGPSGSGKGTIVGRLGELDMNIRHSISATTRKPRVNETDGVNYFFKSDGEFDLLLKNGDLLEWDEYCGNRYGTPKGYIYETASAGKDIILEITVEGAFAVRKEFPDAILIFLLPPNIDELRKRIVGRSTESPDIIEKRLQQAKEEIRFAGDYDYVILNDNIEEAVDIFRSIITAERCRASRNKKLIDLIGGKAL
jgi:guanylate kinase